MTNDRLRTAMFRAGMDAVSLGEAVGVDPKTVARWVAGRTPHRRTRMAVAARLDESEAGLWPTVRPSPGSAGTVTDEIVAAYSHRADVPTALWESLLLGVRERIDIVGISFLFFFEQDVRLPDMVRAKCASGAQVRLAIADPDGSPVAERNAIEDIGGKLEGRIRNALAYARELQDIPGVHIGLHRVYLYNAGFRFDDQMIVTPYLFGTRSYQLPTLHLRRHEPDGFFAGFANEFEHIWQTVTPLTDWLDQPPASVARRPF